MIYVDSLCRYPGHASGTELWCHMVSDQGLEELHEFARSIGLEGRGFGGDHYDLPPAFRERAIRAGAVAVGSKELVRRMRPRRTPRGSQGP